MDLPPTIPTSFVPRPAAAAARRAGTDLAGAFSIFAYLVLLIVFLLSVGVFFYERILVASEAAKSAQLKTATEGIDPATVEGFIRLRDRLSSGATLLGNHIAFSNFFTALGTFLPTTVRFTTLHLSLDSASKVKVEGTGSAMTFNALAAASAAFATDGRIKDAIFSNIVVNSRDNSVSFTFTAALDPKLITFSP